MYDTYWQEKLVRQLKQRDERKEISGQETLLLEVELGLRLLEQLDLLDEPITVLWVMLSGLPIPDPRLSRFSGEQKRMVANVRVLLTFHSRFRWEDALRDYAALPEQWRAYQVQAKDLDRQLVANARLHGCFEERLIAYDSCLTSPLAFRKQATKLAEFGQITSFLADVAQGKKEVALTLPLALTPIVAKTAPVTMGAMRKRQALSVTYQELLDAAATLDQKADKPNWVDRAKRYLRYATVQADGNLSAINEQPLTLNGMAHLVGMVGSGKSTLMILLATHAVLKTDWRVTLVVGDTMTALRLADQFNRHLCSDSSSPVAVALLGRSTREKHLRELYRARDFHSGHTGLRWLSTICPLQGFIKPGDLPAPLPVGKEPCENLLEPEVPDKKSRGRLACPLFHVCPSHQVYRDMSTAPIWITTPGALGVATVPTQVDTRRIKLGDLIYEQSDIVVFDEVDTIQEWFDNLLAPEIKLFDPHGNGVLDQADVNVAQTWVTNRTRSPADRRWRKAERQAVDAGSSILSQLEQIQILPQWIQRNYFSALSLFFKLARRLVDLPDYKHQADDPIKAEQAIALFDIFKDLMTSDLLKRQKTAGWFIDPGSRLADIAQRLVASGDSIQNADILAECHLWIQNFVPNIATTLNTLETRQAEWDTLQRKLRRPPAEPRPDDLNSLAQRLEFALHVAIMDRNMRIVFYEWEKHDLTDTPQPNYRTPRHLTALLPIPPTGKLFGSYFSQDMNPEQDTPFGADSASKASRLSVFGYNNIGRWYVRHFHELRTALDGHPGPHVLAMSGTSWLPDSSRWHFDEYKSLPQGVLQPSEDTMAAIEQSRFKFLPQYEKDSEGNLYPISISGHSDKLGQIRKVVRGLMGIGRGRAFLPEMLAELERKEGTLWQDRARILLLVNSYAQADAAAREMQQHAGEWRNTIYALVPGDSLDDEGFVAVNSLERLNIERFAATKGKILIAPLQAIGRGYNILNDKGLAAFGAVYFLTRPMPHPYDTQAIVRELNYKTLAWCRDKNFPAWREGSLYLKGLALREAASQWWRQIEHRSYYRQLDDIERLDLAATTAGFIIQACGRLLRGGVPFYGFFVDAAWAGDYIRSQKPATPQTSLLAAIIQVLQIYTEDAIGKALYEPLYNALATTENFDFTF